MNNAISGSSGSGQRSVSVAVVTAVAARRDVDPIELPPLYEWLDPDALDALFAPMQRGGSRSGHLEFTYDGHEITVDCTDEMSITVDGTLVGDSVAAEFESESPIDA
ncbi:HalOD1 output domain-containing protein [Natrinema sp. 74]|uniref:HalOD1 output domain-containing protein n=1 Tax=Natrinema sp. 74 TaxID=3384159 RepID=UPI0038D37C01